MVKHFLTDNSRQQYALYGVTPYFLQYSQDKPCPIYKTDEKKEQRKYLLQKTCISQSSLCTFFPKQLHVFVECYRCFPRAAQVVNNAVFGGDLTSDENAVLHFALGMTNFNILFWPMTHYII